MHTFRCLLWLTLLLFLPLRNSESMSLSKQARISLLTCSPANEVYSVFGHSAIHVYDPDNRLDLVFNYGVFSLNSDYFIWNFVRGNTDYKLAVQPMDRFKREYMDEGRWVFSHTFNLSPTQRQAFFDFLIENSKPENATYLYNSLFDNCATRIREGLFHIIHDSIQYQFQHDYFFAPPEIHEKYNILTRNYHDNTHYTFRNLLDLYLMNHPWLDFGIDIVLGRDTDKTASLYQQMFLPDFLMFILSNATQQINGVRFPLITEYKVVVNPPVKVSKKRPPFLLQPTFIFLLLLIGALVISIVERVEKKTYLFFDAILFGLVGLVGVIAFFVSYFSIHPVVNPNFNLFWSHPLHLLFGVALLAIKDKSKLAYYHYFSILLLVLFFFCWIAGLQQFHAASILLAMTLFVRHFFMLRHSRKEKRGN